MSKPILTPEINKQDYGAYLHCKPDGTPFYVGKGRNRRVGDLSTGRNTWHQRVVNKYGRNNIIKSFYSCSSEDIAFDLEAGLIKLFKRNGYELCNIDSGGKHYRNYKPSKESIQKTADKIRGRVQSKEEKLARSLSMRGIPKPPRTEEHKNNIGAKIKGRRWYNNGENVVFCYEGHQPEGYVLGRRSNKLVSEHKENF